MVARCWRTLLPCLGSTEVQDERPHIPPSKVQPLQVDRAAAQLLKLLHSDIYPAVVEGGPCGKREATYMDHAASGRPLKSFDSYMQEHVQPFYANTHTDASEFGTRTNALMEQARLAIAGAVHAPRDEYAVIFAGAGATNALHLLAHVLLHHHHHHNSRATLQPLVFLSHFEHHSNELLWREQKCDIVVIDENGEGRLHLAQLEFRLRQARTAAPDRLLIGCFSAGSNVTGVSTPVDEVSVLMHQYGGLACFDYAAAGSYSLPHMTACIGADPMSYKDAVALSPHKLPGGPGASGVLVSRRELFRTSAPPRIPGGGTVVWTSQYGHAFTDDIEAREEAGTPNILGNIRCGMALQLFAIVSQHVDIHKYEKALVRQLVQGLMAIPGVVVLASDRPAFTDWSTRLGIVSFLVQSPMAVEQASTDTIMVVADGCDSHEGHCSAAKRSYKLLHHNFVCKLLSDVYGIQARSGCNCAGPYGLNLLMPTYRKLLAGKMSGIQGPPETGTSPCCVRAARYHEGTAPAVDASRLEAQLMQAMAEMGAPKAGWVRLSIKYLNTIDDINYAVQAVQQVAKDGWRLLPQYQMDTKTGSWQWVGAQMGLSPQLPAGGCTAALNTAHCAFPYSHGAPPCSKRSGRKLQGGPHLSTAQLAATKQKYLKEAERLYKDAAAWVLAARKINPPAWQGRMEVLPCDIERWRWWMSPCEATASLLVKSAAHK